MRVLSVGHGRKSDADDAVSVAVAARSVPSLRQVRVDDQAVVLHLLTKRRRDLVAARTQTINRLHRLLMDPVPGGARRNLTAKRAAALLAQVAPTGAPAVTRWQLASELVATSIVAIRGWAITLDSALARFAVSQHSRAFLLVALLATASSWSWIWDFAVSSCAMWIGREEWRRNWSRSSTGCGLPGPSTQQGQRLRPQVRLVRAYWTTLVFHVPLAVLLALGAARIG